MCKWVTEWLLKIVPIAKEADESNDFTSQKHLLVMLGECLSVEYLGAQSLVNGESVEINAENHLTKRRVHSV